MPVKRKGKRKPPKSGKKKLTKAEKDKLKQEEDEKRLQEEEEEKQKKLQEEKDRAEKEKLEAVERKRLEAEEAKKRKAQLQELNEVIDANTSFIRNQNSNRRKQAKWDRYMKCDGSADPTIAGEINTYINLEREDNSHNSIEAVLPKCKHTRELIEELEFIIADTPEAELGENELQQYQQTIQELERLVNEKLDLASHDVALKATQLMNSETLNLQSVFEDERVRLYIWGNLSKNPRIKSFEFPGGAISFDIPKLLTLSDCGYRCLVTKFDHLSHLSKSYLPRKKVIEDAPAPEPAEPVVAEEEQEKKEGEGQGEDAEDGVDRENTERESNASHPLVVPDDDDAEELRIGNTMDDLMAMLNKPAEEDESEEQEEKAVEEQPEVIEDDLIKTPEPEDFEDFDGDEDMVDLRAYRPLGGIVHFNLFHMPPQPKAVKSWTITKHPEPPHLHIMEYVADEVNPQAQALKSQATEDDPSIKREERPSISVQLKVPEDTFFFEDPLLARWDEKKLVWRQDGFQDTTFVEETRRLSFKTCHFGTFALLQDVHINMPFQSWEVRPKGLNNCLFTLIAAIVELEIEIKDTQCCLRAPTDRSEVAHLRGQWMPLDKFQQALRATGINIFPNEDSHKYVTTQDKNAIAEARLYQQMGLTASSMAYSWSKWNGEQEAAKLIIQGAPHMVDEPLTEDDWSLFLITRKRSMKLRMSEYDEEFSEDFAEGTEFHADMYHMALQIAPDEGQKRISSSSKEFTHLVTELLKSTRFLIYS